MNTKKRYLLSFFIFLGLLMASSAAVADCWKDSPGCPCYVDPNGVWDPSGDLLFVAIKTRDTVECCVDNGGKPFYQMQMGISHLGQAYQFAPLLSVLKRKPWCTEAVAYWHLRAQIPYSEGYTTWWHPSWQLTNTTQIRLWYLMANSLFERGRWISAYALDLDNFAPGYNAPCPGAYQQIMGYIPFANKWLGSENAHSQVINWMRVYHRPDGTVINFDLGMVEGNSGNRVRNDHVYYDAPRYTPQGGVEPEDFIDPARLRKIRGWGIDLGPSGEPLCNWDAITYVEVPLNMPPPFPDLVPGTYVDKGDQIKLEKRLDFAQAVADIGGGPIVSFGDNPAVVTELPNGRSPWKIKDDLFEANLASVYIKYPKPLPDPVGLVEIHFAGTNSPEKVTIEAKEYGRKDLPGHPRGKLRNREASMELAEGMQTAFLSFNKGIVAKKFRIELKRRPEGSGSPITIVNLYFHAYLDPKYEDSDINE